MQGDIVQQGWALMLSGMGTVIVFLCLLVAATSCMSRLVNRYFPEPQPAAGEEVRGEHERDGDDPDPATIAAIATAVHRYRSGSR